MTWNMRGRRVQLPAHTDAWMRGDRFGVIVAQASTFYRVRMDKSRRTYRIAIADIENFGEYL